MAGTWTRRKSERKQEPLAVDRLELGELPDTRARLTMTTGGRPATPRRVDPSAPASSASARRWAARRRGCTPACAGSSARRGGRRVEAATQRGAPSRWCCARALGRARISRASTRAPGCPPRVRSAAAMVLGGAIRPRAVESGSAVLCGRKDVLAPGQELFHRGVCGLPLGRILEQDAFDAGHLVGVHVRAGRGLGVAPKLTRIYAGMRRVGKATTLSIAVT